MIAKLIEFKKYSSKHHLKSPNVYYKKNYANKKCDQFPLQNPIFKLKSQ